MKDLPQQPAIRVDYQLSSKLRVTGKYSGERARVLVTPGQIAGFTDVLFPYPFITNYAFTANYALSPTTFLEGTYGFIRNELRAETRAASWSTIRRTASTAMPDFPLLYPDAGMVDSTVLRNEVLQRYEPGVLGRQQINLPPCSVGAAASARRRPTSATRVAEHQPDAGRRD